MRRVEAFLFAREDARRLAAVRIGLCGLLAFRLALGDYASVAGQPRPLFQPLSFMKLFPEMPGYDVTVVLQTAGVSAALVAAVGLWARASLPLAFLCSLVLNGMLNSTGKVVHNDVLLTLCLIPLLVTPRAAVAAWSLAALRRRRALRMGPLLARRDARSPVMGEAFGWPIRTAMVVVALAYFFVGFQKLRYSGAAWFTSENLRWVLYASSDGQPSPNPLALFVADRPWLAHLLAAGTVAVEVGFPLCLVFAALRWFFIPAVVSIHLGIRLVMGLDYSAWWITVLIVFVNWPLVLARLRRKVEPLHSPLGRQELAADLPRPLHDHVLLYDQDCGFCRWSLDKILAWDRRRRIRPVPIQGEEGQRLLSEIPPDQRLQSWHLVTPVGQVLSRGAVAEPLARLLPWGRPLAFLFHAFPAVTERAYLSVAANRDRWSR